MIRRRLTDADTARVYDGADSSTHPQKLSTHARAHVTSISGRPVGWCQPGSGPDWRIPVRSPDESVGKGFHRLRRVENPEASGGMTGRPLPDIRGRARELRRGASGVSGVAPMTGICRLSLTPRVFAGRAVLYRDEAGIGIEFTAPDKAAAFRVAAVNPLPPALIIMPRLEHKESLRLTAIAQRVQPSQLHRTGPRAGRGPR